MRNDRRWWSPPGAAVADRVDRSAAVWAVVAAVVWVGLFTVWLIIEVCTVRFYDPMLGGPGLRGWAMLVNGAFAVWLVVALVPLVWRRRRDDAVRRIAIVGALALLGAVHLMLTTFGLVERAFPRDELAGRVRLYTDGRARWLIEVDRDELDPIEDRLRADLRAAGGNAAPSDPWPGVLGAVKKVPPPLRFRTFTMRVDDGRLRIGDRDFGAVAADQRILIRYRTVFVDGERRGAFRE